MNDAISFHPGDRVTVWQERFFCPNCISQQNVATNTPNKENQKVNGSAPLSPLSVTDDEGCISAAEASLSDFASPQSKAGTKDLGDKFVECEKKEEFRLPSSDSKCMPSSGIPQKSKSILRKTGTEPDKLRTSSREHGYLSTDSGLGERMGDSTLASEEESSANQVWEEHSPTTESLHSRVPNSDYGRHLSQSYMHLGDPPAQSDRYKRNVSFTSLNKPTKTKHFHIPETKNRYLPPGVRTSELLFGQPVRNTLSTTDGSQARRVLRRPVMTRSAMELDQKTADTSISTSIPPDMPNGVAYPPSTNGIPVNGDSQHVSPSETTSSRLGTNTLRATRPDEQEVTAEARRLACYPAGQQRDLSVPAPIERYDWPGPPASAVILAELIHVSRVLLWSLVILDFGVSFSLNETRAVEAQQCLVNIRQTHVI
ncbi:unnamed protein product [Echinostoma caproni]|uniref:LIM zinc-binding domain-containing protein n=1 Tax=Echinostoma caproni TaxID=27848 RepID=A0A183AAV1_9TREM|nr:unnamed protein product [Echinostoma caproni]